MTIPIELPTINVPYMLREIILKTLANPRATPDAALILADAIDELASELPPTSHFIPSCRQCANAVRNFAPNLKGNIT